MLVRSQERRMLVMDRRSAGFTLIELIVVMALVAIGTDRKSTRLNSSHQ